MPPFFVICALTSCLAFALDRRIRAVLRHRVEHVGIGEATREQRAFGVEVVRERSFGHRATSGLRDRRSFGIQRGESFFGSVERRGVVLG